MHPVSKVLSNKCNSARAISALLAACSRAEFEGSASTDAVQRGEYENGKRKNPDQKRQLYKMYIALILTEIVNETPLDKIVKMFFPADKSLVRSEAAWEAHVAKHEKEISSLQVRAP
jgi:hypothetical protein